MSDEQEETCGFCDKPCGNPWCVTKRSQKCHECGDEGPHIRKINCTICRKCRVVLRE